MAPGLERAHVNRSGCRMATNHLAPVPLEKACRLINHGPTVLVSARHEGVANVMAAAWCCALDFSPPKLSVVLDKSSATRALIEGSGRFVVQVPTAALLQLTHAVGNVSLNDDADKLAHCGVELFGMARQELPFVSGCSAWLVCCLIPEPRNQQVYDLFIGEVVAAWADARVFREGRWHYDRADPGLRSLHYVAGGQFYAIGESLLVPGAEED